MYSVLVSEGKGMHSQIYIFEIHILIFKVVVFQLQIFIICKKLKYQNK